MVVPIDIVDTVADTVVRIVAEIVVRTAVGIAVHIADDIGRIVLAWASFLPTDDNQLAAGMIEAPVSSPRETGN